MSLAAETDPDLAAAIDALRAGGAQGLDPVRFRHIEALQRRAAAHRGPTRRVLDDKLARLLANCGHAVEQARCAPAVGLPRVPRRSALADLLAHVATLAAELGAATGGDALSAQAPVELKAVRNARSTWSGLRVDQQMTHALANVPDNAGPLNTQKLVHQALSAMREASPEYAHRFMEHVEALLWLDQASPAVTTVSTKRPRRSARDR